MNSQGVVAVAIASWRAGLRRVLDFRGRARPAEYWWCVAAVAAPALGLHALAKAAGHGRLASLAPVLALLLVSVTVRRLHDVNRSAWSLLVGLIPVAGNVVTLTWLLSGGTPGLNRYGPSPTLPPEKAYATPRARRRVHIDAQGNVIDGSKTSARD
jgi:uncharacterized membrane protein YhaH (DUF805 family)